MPTNNNFRVKNAVEFSDSSVQSTAGQPAFSQVLRADIESANTNSSLAIVLDSGSDSPNTIDGMLAYWDRTNNQWAYVISNLPVTTGGGGAGYDQYYSNVLFLLEASANDDTTGNITFTNNGVTQSSAQNKFGNTYSWYVDGGDNTNITVNDAIVQMGTDNWTLDMWMWSSSNNTSYNALFAWDNEMEYRHEPGGDWAWLDFGQGIYPSAFATNPTIDGWTFVTFERHGSNFNIYLDGVRVYQGSASDMNINHSTIWFGNEATNKGWEGYYDYIRFTSVARHEGSNFTPPTSAGEYMPAP